VSPEQPKTFEKEHSQESASLSAILNAEPCPESHEVKFIDENDVWTAVALVVVRVR
jgi:hypothetical protein